MKTLREIGSAGKLLAGRAVEDAAGPRAFRSGFYMHLYPNPWRSTPTETIYAVGLY